MSSEEKKPPEAPRSATDEYFDNLRTILKRDCETHRRTIDCHQYAEFLQSVDRNHAAAGALFSELCLQRSHGASCLQAGIQHLSGKGLPQSFASAYTCFQRACGLGSNEACNNAGMIVQSGTDGVARSSREALAFFVRSCKGGFHTGCFNASNLYIKGSDEVPKDMPLALQYALLGCERGHFMACANASRMLDLGDGVPQDKAKAQELRARAVELKTTK